MSIMLKLIDQSFETTHRLPNMTGQHTTKTCQVHHKQMLHNNPLKNSNNYLEKGRGKARCKELHSHQPFGHKTHSLESHIQWKIKKNQCLHERYTSHH